jgi:hypothetical protein
MDAGRTEAIQAGSGSLEANGPRHGFPGGKATITAAGRRYHREVADDSQTPIGDWVDSYYDIGPQAYVFVRTGDLGRETYRDIAIQPAQNVDFITQTRNVTNIAFGGNGVVANGPDYNQIASRAKIAQYKLNYVSDNQGKFGTSVAGNQLQVMSPAMNLQRNATVQPKVERQLAQAGVDHGWKGIDQSRAAQIKESIQQQAPPPASLPQRAPAKPATVGGQNQPAQGQQPARVSGRLQHLLPLQRRLQTSNVRLNSQLRAKQTRQARRLRKHSRICNSILLRQRREKTISLQRALLAEGHRER